MVSATRIMGLCRIVVDGRVWKSRREFRGRGDGQTDRQTALHLIHVCLFLGPPAQIYPSLPVAVVFSGIPYRPSTIIGNYHRHLRRHAHPVGLDRWITRLMGVRCGGSSFCRSRAILFCEARMHFHGRFFLFFGVLCSNLFQSILGRRGARFHPSIHPLSSSSSSSGLPHSARAERVRAKSRESRVRVRVL